MNQKILVSTQLALVQIPSTEIQIKVAVLAAPEDKRAGATVYGYDAAGKFILLRKGINELVCLTDDS